MARLALLLLAFSVLALGTVAGCSLGRLVEAARVLADIRARSGPSELKDSTPAPIRQPIAFEVDGRAHAGDVYIPREVPLAGMVLLPGAVPAGKDDPGLIAFATTFARARFKVLVPDLPGMRSLQVTIGDSRAIADAAIHLRSVDPSRPLGMTAISFAAGPAVVSMFEPGAKDLIDFIITIGGYYDLEAAITYFTTGYFRASPGSAWQYREPNAYGRWVFVRSNASRLDDPGDRQVLTEMAERKLDNPYADVSDLVPRLGPKGRAVYTLLVNWDPNRVPALIQELPSDIVSEIAALDLKRRDLASLNVRFMPIHGRNDRIIPETESIALAAAVPQDRVNLFLIDSLDHVSLRPPGVGDALRLWHVVYTVLTFRDGSEEAPQPSPSKPRATVASDHQLTP